MRLIVNQEISRVRISHGALENMVTWLSGLKRRRAKALKIKLPCVQITSSPFVLYMEDLRIDDLNCPENSSRKRLGSLNLPSSAIGA